MNTIIGLVVRNVCLILVHSEAGQLRSERVPDSLSGRQDQFLALPAALYGTKVKLLNGTQG